MKAIKFMLVTFLFLLTILWFSNSCKNDNSVDPDDPMTITWQQTSLDSLKILHVAANSRGDVFAIGCVRPIFRTSDQGYTWTPVFPSACASFLAVSPEDEIFAVGGFGFLFSSDNGNNWQSDVLDIPGVALDLKAIAFHPSGAIFAGSVPTDESSGGIYRSIDNGQTWAQTTFPDSIGGRNLVVNSKGQVFSGTAYGVFRSDDLGDSWQLLTDGIRDPGRPPTVSALALDPTSDALYAAIRRDAVYRSTDDGYTWNYKGLDGTIDHTIINAIIVDRIGNVFAASHNPQFEIDLEGIFLSSDHGQTWTLVSRGLTNTSIFSLTIDTSNYLYAATRGDGVFRSEKSINQ